MIIAVKRLPARLQILQGHAISSFTITAECCIWCLQLYANKVGPFQNPTETYQFYNLPFCAPQEGKEYKIEGLGEVLEGDRLVNTPYSLKFRQDVENQVLCSKTLNNKDLKAFRDAVKQDYYFQVPYQCNVPHR